MHILSSISQVDLGSSSSSGAGTSSQQFDLKNCNRCGPWPLILGLPPSPSRLSIHCYSEPAVHPCLGLGCAYINCGSADCSNNSGNDNSDHKHHKLSAPHR